MGYARQFVRLFFATQLLPVIENGEETTLVGGQAVLEGVMMRSPHAWAISVRKPNGEIATHAAPLPRPSDKHPWMRWPILRGIVTLGHAMALGFRALKYSANVVLEQVERKPEEKPLEIPGWLLAINLLFSVAFLLFMYKFVPLVAATALRRVNPVFENQILFAVTDGIVRLAIFLLFLWGISRFADIRRMFEYHGAEHKTVFCFEAGDELRVEQAQRFVTWHPRCGTSFLMTVMLICIAVYAAVPMKGAVSSGHGLLGMFDRLFWMRFGLRIALLPLIVGVSYEIIRYAARNRGSLFALMTKPGLWLQRITTQPPADQQVECAISALDHAMSIEKVNGGELVIA